MAYLLAKDTVTGAEGSVVVTKEGRNYVAVSYTHLGRRRCWRCSPRTRSTTYT